MKKFLPFLLLVALAAIPSARAVDPYQENLKYLNGSGVEVYLSTTIGIPWIGLSAPTNAQLQQAQANLGLPIWSSFSPTTNQVLTWNGTAWAPGAGGGSSSLTAYSLLANDTNATATGTSLASTQALLAWLQNPTSANLAAAMVDPTGSAGNLVFSNDPTLNKYTLTGSPIFTPTAMGAFVVDVTKPVNTLSISAPETITFSSNSPTVGTRVILEVSADSTARVLTLPVADTFFSVNRNGNITTVTVPASGTLVLTFENTGATAWNIYGDPVATTGTGTSFVTNALPTVAGIINSAGQINSGVIQASLSGDTTNWNPSGWLSSGTAAVSEIQVTSSAAMAALSGLVAPSTAGQIAGTRVVISNYGTNTILLKDNASGLSTAANAFELGGYDIPLWPNDSVQLSYDANNSLWRCTNSAGKAQPPTRRYGLWYSRPAFVGNDTGDPVLSFASITSTGSNTLTAPDGHFLATYIHGATTAGSTFKVGFGATSGEYIGTAGNYWRSTYLLRLPQAGGSVGSDFYMRVGWCDSSTGSQANNGVYITYDNQANSGNYILVVTNAGTATTKNLSVGPPVSTTVPFRIDIDVTSTLAEVYQNGTLIGSQTTLSNMPVNPVGPLAYLITGASGSTNDLFDVGALEVLQYNGTP